MRERDGLGMVPAVKMTSRTHSISTGCLVATVVVLVACTGSRIDASSDASCVSSFTQVSKQAFASPDSARYASVMLSVGAQAPFSDLGHAFGKLGNMFDEQGPSVEMPPPDSSLFRQALCDGLNGMTAQEIIARGDSLATGVKSAYERRYAPLEISALQVARTRYQSVAESLGRFKVVSARLDQERGFLGLEATIALTVENGTTHPVRKAFFHGRVVSNGRSV